MFLGFLMNIVLFPKECKHSYVPWCHVADEYKLCSSVLMSMRIYLSRYVSWLYFFRDEEYKLFLSYKHMFFDF
jgi:hypothetical protein